MNVGEAHVGGKIPAATEIIAGLSRKADDEVGGDSSVRIPVPHHVQGGAELRRAVSPRMRRRMRSLPLWSGMWKCFISPGVAPQVKELFRNLVGLQGRYPQPFNAGLRQDAGQQSRQVKPREVKSVGSELRAGQRHLAVTLIGMEVYLRDDFLCRMLLSRPRTFGTMQ